MGTPVYAVKGIVGPPGPIAASVTSLAALGTLDAAGRWPTGTVAYEQTAKSYWTLDRTSTATPDGVKVVAAATTGRWLLWSTQWSSATVPAPASPAEGDSLIYDAGTWTRLPVGSAGQALGVAAGKPAWVPQGFTSSTVAGLSAIPDAPLNDGQRALVTATNARAYWVLSKTSTLTADAVTVVATQSGTGRWILESRARGGPVPVTEVGADPTGSVDSLAAVNAAAAALSGTGAAIVLLAGTYQLSAAPTIPGHVPFLYGPDVTFTGAGASSMPAPAIQLGQGGQVLAENGARTGLVQEVGIGATDVVQVGDGTLGAGVDLQARSGGAIRSVIGGQAWSALTSAAQTWTVPVVQFDATVTAPVFGQAATSTATQGQPSTWQPQQSTQTTNFGGGNAVIQLQAPGGSGAEAAVVIERGTTPVFRFGVWASGYYGIWLGTAANAPTTANAALFSDGSTTYVNGPTSLQFQVGDATVAFFSGTVNSYSVPLEGNSSAASAAAAPLRFNSTAIGVAGSNITLSVAQSSTPVLVFSGTLTANITVTLPSARALFEVDCTGVTFGGFSITFQYGTTTKTFAMSTAVYALLRGDGAAKLYGFLGA